ncbi:hypothetical protein EYM_06705 [Ignicoccus islandicus DSM 13165]|uniref:Probable membrane transporter protein n=1 Tax=Ignicoccus islandicus DSM 13165 TaxID=940295 RepID=A0A0U3FAK9_9CREN|nr:sulfite exporter TauE/SafE family protein [Ignicoccus islandicus]ALU12713.1 hypothetical protein EYM_06705 [Ignicoccus islandicus DSM 13165]
MQANLIGFAEILVIAIITGVVASLFGVGGGVISIPSMIFLLGVDPSVAVGTNSVIIIASTLSSAWFHLRQGTLRKEGIYLGIGGVIGTVIGNYLFLIASQMKVMDKVLGILFIIISALVVTKTKGTRTEPPEKTALILSGVLLGTFAGLAGMSGGVLINPILMLVFDMDVKIAIGTSVAALPMTAIASALPKIAWGYVDWELALAFLPGIIIGTKIGSKLMKEMDRAKLKKLFALLMLLMGVKMLI